MNDTMLVSQIERCAVNDGPGIRTTVFFQGCPLHCYWCCNPETQPYKSVWMHDSFKCIGCGKCVESCPEHSLVINEGKLVNTSCTECRTCQSVCPKDAITFSSNEMLIDDILKEVLKDKLFYDESGGGITLSGGEPLIQRNILSLLRLLKENHLNVYVETTANVGSKIVSNVWKYIDGFYIDFKHPDRKVLNQYAGADLSLIKSNIEYIINNGGNVTLRTPVIPMFNDDMETMSNIFSYAISVGLNKHVLLPFHSLGKKKYDMLNKKYLCADMKTQPQTELMNYVELGDSMGIDVIIQR